MWIINLKKYLKGDVLNLSAEEAKLCGRLADRYEVDEENLLFFCPANATQDADRETVAKLVVPETLQQDILHHYHTSLEGDH